MEERDGSRAAARSGSGAGEDVGSVRAARVAAATVAVEAAAVLGFAGWLGVELLIAEPDDVSVAQGSALYFLLCGVGLAVLAVQLWRRARWAYGAAVAVQLVVLLVCWSMAQGGFWPGAVGGAALVVTCLASLLTPRGRAAFGR